MSVDSYFEKLKSPMKEIALELRKIIMSVSPEIKEELKWNSPTYALKRNFCSVMSHKHHVNLQIFQGAHLKDADQLDGTGKSMRHLKFTALEEVREEVVRKYLEQAVEIEYEHT